MTFASAPGKLVIFGDYAVLEGTCAAATSVDVRARAQVDVIEGRDSIFIDLAGGKAYEFVVEPGTSLRWTGESPGARGTIVAAVLDTCHDLVHLRGAIPALRISVNTDSFFTRVGDATEKLGLGSSAAALVALTGALITELKVPIEHKSLLNICYAAHRHLQAGQGSGIDVTAAFLGGVVGIRRDRRQPYPVAETLVWPEGLYMLPVWSGNGASTPELISRFMAYRAADEDGFSYHLRSLARFATQADAAWRGGAVAEILSALTGYDNALHALDYDAHIGINTESHERLRRLTEQHGAVYKTSGAGGGDFGIALSDSAQVLAAVKAELIGTQFTVLESAVNVAGLQCGSRDAV